MVLTLEVLVAFASMFLVVVKHFVDPSYVEIWMEGYEDSLLPLHSEPE